MNWHFIDGTVKKIISFTYIQVRNIGDQFMNVNNDIARRSWARNEEAIFAIKRAMDQNPNLKVTIPNLTDESLLDKIVK